MPAETGEEIPVETPAVDTSALEKRIADQEAKIAESNRLMGEMQQRYAQDMSQVTGYVQQYLQSNQSRVDPYEGLDEEERQRRVAEEERVQRAANTAVAPVVQQYFEGQKAYQAELMALKYGDEWKKYKDEVENMLRQYPPNVAGGKGAYEGAFQAVRALHLDDIVNERVAKATAAKATEETDEEEEEPTTPSVRGAQSPARRKVAKEKSPFAQLPKDDRAFLQDVGVSDEDFNRYGDPNYTSDVFGFKGRDRV